MILPLALVDRWPDEPYASRHPTIEEALRANTRDALLVWYEIELIKDKFRHNDENRSEKIHDKKLKPYLRSRREQLNLLLKYSDFTAMTMAAYHGAELMERSKFWDNANTIERPILIRGIASAPLGDYMLERGHDFYFIETGYMGNYPSKNNDGGRKLFHRIVKNAMQHTSVWDVPDDRWQDLCKFNRDLEYTGWKQNRGSKILLVAPSEKPCKYYGIDQDTWIEETIKTIQQYTDREIVVRTKNPRWQRSQNTIYEALDDDIWATVTYNSIAAVESVHRGVPAFALAPTAAQQVCSDKLQDIESPFRPDKEFVYKWLCSIAYSQFHMFEMINGTAWQMVLENEYREKIDYQKLP